MFLLLRHHECSIQVLLLFLLLNIYNFTQFLNICVNITDLLLSIFSQIIFRNEIFSDIDKALNKLHDLWNDCGFNEAGQAERRNVVKQHLLVKFTYHWFVNLKFARIFRNKSFRNQFRICQLWFFIRHSKVIRFTSRFSKTKWTLRKAAKISQIIFRNYIFIDIDNALNKLHDLWNDSGFNEASQFWQEWLNRNFNFINVLLINEIY